MSRPWHCRQPWRLVGGACALAAAAAVAPPRVVAIADLHGDLDHASAVLRAAGLVQGEGERARWVGGNATLVQLGDLVDRGSDARGLYALFARLRPQALAAGGRVVNLLGNHEAMNVMGDFRYVEKSDVERFGGASERRAAFAADGEVGRQILEEFEAAWVAGGSLFAHAGLLPEHVARGVDALNTEVRAQLQKAAAAGPAGRKRRGPLLKATGPVWLRRLAKGPERLICPLVMETLRLVGGRRMVVGHTQVDEGVVRPRCGGRLLLADTIISKDGYPECWEPGSMQAEGCEGSASFVEMLGRHAFAVRVAGDSGAVLERSPLPISQTDFGEL